MRAHYIIYSMLPPISSDSITPYLILESIDQWDKRIILHKLCQGHDVQRVIHETLCTLYRKFSKIGRCLGRCEKAVCRLFVSVWVCYFPGAGAGTRREHGQWVERTLCDASVRGVCVCLCLCGRVIVCESSMYACISVFHPFWHQRRSAEESEASARKIERELLCVPKRGCIIKSLVLAP